MKYLLCMGFFCNVYKVEPKVRIFLNDILIDEVTLEHQDKIFANRETHFLCNTPLGDSTLKNLPKFITVYLWAYFTRVKAWAPRH